MEKGKAHNVKLFFLFFGQPVLMVMVLSLAVSFGFAKIRG